MISIEIIKKYIFILSICSFILTFLLGETQMSILPLLYGILTKYLTPKNTVVGGGFLTMLMVLSFRYLLYPLLYTKDPNTEADNLLFYIALALMIIELLVIFLVIYIFYKRKHAVNEPVKSTYVSSVVPVVFLVIMLGYLLSGADLFVNKHFIFSYGIEDKITDDDIVEANVMGKIVEWGQIFIQIYILSLFYKQYVKKSSVKWIFLSIVVLSYNCLFVLNDSRLSLFVPVITTITILHKLYGRKARLPILSLAAFLILSLTLVSLVKFFGETEISEDTNLFSESLINAYFGGINNVIIGLKTFVLNGVRPELIYIDAFRGAMLISKYFAGVQGSAALYNYAIYGGIAQDQIIPTVTQGLLYFGPLFFWLTTVFMVFFVIYGDYKWAKATNFHDAYVWAYCTIIVGWAVPGNMNHLFINLTNSLFPLLVLIFINKCFQRLKFESQRLR